MRPTPTQGRATPPEDPRLAAFREYLGAVDRRDTKAAIASVRALRSHGISVVLTGPSGGRGGRP